MLADDDRRAAGGRTRIRQGEGNQSCAQRISNRRRKKDSVRSNQGRCALGEALSKLPVRPEPVEGRAAPCLWFDRACPELVEGLTTNGLRHNVPKAHLRRRERDRRRFRRERADANQSTKRGSRQRGAAALERQD